MYQIYVHIRWTLAMQIGVLAKRPVLMDLREYNGKTGQPNPRESPFALFGSVRNKLLVLMIALSLLPLIGMSIFSYWIGKNQIQERIRLSLGKMAQDTADKVDLMLRGKKEEIRSMATTYSLIYSGLKSQDRPSPRLAAEQLLHESRRI